MMNSAKRWSHELVHDHELMESLHPDDVLGVWQHRQSFRFAIRHKLDTIVLIKYPLTEDGVNNVYAQLFGHLPETPFVLYASGKKRTTETIDDPWSHKQIIQAAHLCNAPILIHLGTLDLPHGSTCPMLGPDPSSTNRWRLFFRFTIKSNTVQYHHKHNMHTVDVDIGHTTAKIVVNSIQFGTGFPCIDRPNDVKSVVDNSNEFIVFNNLGPTSRAPAAYNITTNQLIFDAKNEGIAVNDVEKNYTPFVTLDGTVMFFRWFQPLEIYKLQSNGNVMRVDTGDNDDRTSGSIADDSWRGGTNGLALDNHTVVGFGRRTLTQHRSLHGLIPDVTHRTFFWSLDTDTWSFEIFPVNGPCGTVTDPISLRCHNGRYLLTTVEGSASFDKERLTLKCEVYDATTFIESHASHRS
jgi:hypothetical protein